ncbi:MAG: hypothetical protein ACI9U2_004445, partial [Bradymonadia bacterium]
MHKSICTGCTTAISPQTLQEPTPTSPDILDLSHDYTISILTRWQTWRDRRDGGAIGSRQTTPEDAMPYDLLPLAAPRSAGGLLRLFVALAEGPVGGPLSTKFFKDIGLNRLRAATPDDAMPVEHGLLAAARIAMPADAADEAPPAAASPAAASPAAASPAAASPAATPPAGPTYGAEPAHLYEAAYRTGESTPTQVAERLIAAIDARESGERPLRAVIARDIADLMAQARASTERWAAGAPLGPLDGVPIGVKDEVWQAGYPTTVGTAFLAHGPEAEDATVVARLRAAGALLYGKLNMHELGMGVTGINPHRGAARNPHDRERCTGGSSSGPGAAVAAGLGPIAVGADGGGSIR